MHIEKGTHACILLEIPKEQIQEAFDKKRSVVFQISNGGRTVVYLQFKIFSLQMDDEKREMRFSGTTEFQNDPFCFGVIVLYDCVRGDVIFDSDPINKDFSSLR
jgi:hypothetical protein